MAASELISFSSLAASTTDSSGSFDVNNLKRTSANDQNNHLTMWQSQSDTSCAFQWITANWESSMGPQTIQSLSVLSGPLSSGRPTNVALKNWKGNNVDITSFLMCSTAKVKDGPNQVNWDICALQSNAPDGIYAGATGISFTFQPPSVNGVCQMNVFELQVFGTATPGLLTPGATVGIVLAVIVALLILVAAFCWVRRRNLGRRKLREDFAGTGVTFESVPVADEWVMESFPVAGNEPGRERAFRE
ncbi:hypothetical protein BC830DRAFT_1167850 [Chytriomyces sp. MP71]|nr:hypothetical protein BC830DRAFT_1167850 [Chytriomyces sp. MP71]